MFATLTANLHGGAHTLITVSNATPFFDCKHYLQVPPATRGYLCTNNCHHLGPQTKNEENRLCFTLAYQRRMHYSTHTILIVSLFLTTDDVPLPIVFKQWFAAILHNCSSPPRTSKRLLFIFLAAEFTILWPIFFLIPMLTLSIYRWSVLSPTSVLIRLGNSSFILPIFVDCNHCSSTSLFML